MLLAKALITEVFFPLCLMRKTSLIVRKFGLQNMVFRVGRRGGLAVERRGPFLGFMRKKLWEQIGFCLSRAR